MNILLFLAKSMVRWHRQEMKLTEPSANERRQPRMKKWMKRMAGAMAAMMLMTAPALAEETARPNITAHKANGIVIDGKLDDWNLDSPAVVEDASQIIRDAVFWQGPNDCSAKFPGMKKTFMWQLM